MVNVRRARTEDACVLARQLRLADLQELKAVTWEDPATVLERSIAQSSPCYAVVNKADEPLALFGAALQSCTLHTGIVWLLATTEFVEHPVWILRNCRKWVAHLHQHYAVLGNFVDVRNEVHIRWLEWCGFKIIRLVEQYGIEQRPFYEFKRVYHGGESGGRIGISESSNMVA
jgi:hypothetical protein